MSGKEIVQARIEYLEELAGSLPMNKQFTVLARLDEARAILKLLENATQLDVIT